MLTTVVAGEFYLESRAAASYARMRAAGCPAGITSASRSYALQADWYAHQGQPGYPAMADHPDRSKHVWRPDDPTDQGGRALDLPSAPAAWVSAYGTPYGWLAGKVKGEWWHDEYQAAHDTKGKTPAPAQEDDMPLSADDLAKVKQVVFDTTYNLWREPEMAAILQAAAKRAVAEAAGAAVWGHRLAKATEPPVAARAWLVDTRIIVGQLPAEIVAALPSTIAGAGVTLTQVEAAVKSALATLQLKSV